MRCSDAESEWEEVSGEEAEEAIQQLEVHRTRQRQPLKEAEASEASDEEVIFLSCKNIYCSGDLLCGFALTRIPGFLRWTTPNWV